MKTLLVNYYKKQESKKFKNIYIGNWIFNNYEEKIKIKHFHNKNLIKKRKRILQNFFLIEDEIIEKILPILNQLHLKSYNKRQWKIIIGQWLRVFLKVFMNRYSNLTSILNKTKIDQFEIKNYISNYFFNDFEDFYKNCDCSQFENLIYEKILAFKNTKTKVLKFNKTLFKQKKKKISIKEFLISILNSFKFKDDKYFFIQLYLSNFNNYILQLKFLIFPKFWHFTQFKDYSVPNYNLRKSLKLKLKINNKKNLKNFLLNSLFEFMPTAYLEDFKNIETFIKKNYPKKPEYIITANSFFFNETFKIYLAEKINFSKYIVLQHGNNYNSHFHEQRKSIEEDTSDYFITWGFKKKNKKYIPGIMQKKVSKSKNNINNLLFMHMAFDGRNTIWENYNDYLIYISNVKQTILELHKINEIKKIIYRVTPDHKNYRNLLFFKNLTPKITFSFCKNSLAKDLNDSNICLFSYNSSGFYENLSNNIPSLLLINRNYLNEIDTQTKKDFLLLKKKNIIFFEPEKLSLFLKKNWNNIYTWWNTKEIQKTIFIFSKKNCVRSKKTCDKLFEIISSI